eukprot:CAMPEP_0202853500 /NCGR_PEP_ID=MMETSP1389-20130828/90513_1 /ASSEMBLY_ACC=CAM_ASM_000865 /TAXON_ID=302021 /ORGANISM="Rhodomonas sp., Strain CCMP768" /LENGTH=108 /DNA_ID=CAMNT_0049532049 /DNA_START=535 /DNA_END=861 /DNA_ORIENTATION=-
MSAVALCVTAAIFAPAKPSVLVDYFPPSMRLNEIPLVEVPGEGLFFAVPVGEKGGQVLLDGQQCKTACRTQWDKCRFGAQALPPHEKDPGLTYCREQYYNWCMPQCFQ